MATGVPDFRQILGRDPANAWLPLRAAGEAINDGLGYFNAAIENRRAMHAADYRQSLVAPKEALLSALASIQSPEQLAAARADGSLGALENALPPEEREQARARIVARQQSLFDAIKAAQERETGNYAYQRNVGLRALHPTQDATAAIGAHTSLAEATDKATTRVPAQEVDRALANRDYATARAAAQPLGPLAGPLLQKITDQERADTRYADERIKVARADTTYARQEEEYKLSNLLNEEGLRHGQRRTAQLIENARAARENGVTLPTLRNGALDLVAITKDPALNAQLDEFYKSAPLMVPSTDTDAAGRFRQELRSQGYSAGAIAKMSDQIDKAFSTAPALIGRDKYEQDKTVAQIEAAQAEAQKNNVFFPGEQNYQKGFDDARKAIVADKSLDKGFDNLGDDLLGALNSLQINPEWNSLPLVPETLITAAKIAHKESAIWTTETNILEKYRQIVQQDPNVTAAKKARDAAKSTEARKALEDAVRRRTLQN
jgi:hypothetical protein